MNERIKELAEQAGMGFGKPFKQTEDTLYIKSDKVADAIATDAGTHQEQVLKFAELIVEECVRLCMNVNGDLPRTEPLVAASIRKYFGVKE